MKLPGYANKKVVAWAAACALGLGLVGGTVSTAVAGPESVQATSSVAAEKSNPNRPPRAVTGLEAVDPQIGQISIQWNATPPEETFVDRYEVYASEDPNGPFGPEQLIAQTIYPHFTHSDLGPKGQTWYYQVVVVNAAGKVSKPSATLKAETVGIPGANGIEIVTVEANVPGADIQDETGEHVVLTNTSDSTIDVSGYVLEDRAGNLLYVGDGYAIAPGAELRVYTAAGTNTADRYYNGGTRNVLNNGGDAVSAFTADGVLVDFHEYE